VWFSTGYSDLALNGLSSQAVRSRLIVFIPETLHGQGTKEKGGKCTNTNSCEGWSPYINLSKAILMAAVVTLRGRCLPSFLTAILV